MHATDVFPISENLVPGSEKLYFFFGGIEGAIGIHPFEFYRSARILDCSRIFFRGPFQSWYQRGLPTVGGDALAIGDYLNARIMESGASQIYFVGNYGWVRRANVLLNASARESDSIFSADFCV